MKKNLNKNLTLFFSSLYPFNSSKISGKEYEVVIGIGGNIGNVKRRFNNLFLTLLKDKRFDIIKTSPILKNPPFGYIDQDDFFNAVIVVKTDLSPKIFLYQMQRFEKRFKRKRSFKDAPRTLDIDIIFFNDKKINSKDLTVPHPHWSERESVTIPLSFVKRNKR